jgi:UDP-N-acetylmuramoyl-tripeptide--D-alanyl-D-alanine ligase
MLGLGEQADRLHRETGDFAAQSCNNIDSLICCGDMARIIYDNYRCHGSGKVYYYPAKADLIAALPGLINKGDSVLVKASRAMKFEEITNYLEQFVIQDSQRGLRPQPSNDGRDTTQPSG